MTRSLPFESPADRPGGGPDADLAAPQGAGGRTADPNDGPRAWTVRGRKLALDRTLVMGVVNVTPDSFYDGGRHATTEEAVAHGLRLLEEGADLLDVGGESTRPGADPVPAGEELDRVLPVVEALVPRAETADALVSVDTSKAAVAKACLDAGVHVVNDVTALGDAGMAGVCADAGCGVVLMHMQGTPKTMQDDPTYDDVMADVCRHLADRRDRAVRAGVPAGSICLDPGLGFGKTPAHNVEILRRLPELRALGHPVLVGPSRKSFLGRLTGKPEAEERLWSTLGAVAVSALKGAHVLRVHDVAEAKQVLAVVDAVHGRRRRGAEGTA